MDNQNPQTVDAYIAQYTGEVHERLLKLRETIRAACPEAAETISWGMPTYKLRGNLVHFAAAQKHIGFYPAPSGVAMFLERCPGFKASKGTVQLPNNKPIPYAIIAEVVRLRAAENTAGKQK